ncbi:L,D-transpeptidase family protein [Paraferrimonas haliotis]|uniref:Peptidase n=1 Tax=Paraferrimonas haliotis TaxID=2013866 RepID=A0AA37TLH1_9GAMM|nr:peptidase [Paraferrimonas haliotis]
MTFRVLFIALLMITSSVQANPYPLPDDGSRLVGRLQYHQVIHGQHLAQIGNMYNVGLIALMEANPGVDPFLPKAGTMLTIPTQALLPDVAHKGIVINLAELRLYFFEPKTNKVHIFPIGIGRVGRETPEMATTISMRIPNPSWTPTKGIRADHLERTGEVLPPMVAGGSPDNPLGLYALKLAYGDGSYLIHGTNKDFGIGMRVSSGCIRMNPADIEWIFDKVRKGTPVRVINQTVKAAREPDGKLIIEVHSPLTEQEGDSVSRKIDFSPKVRSLLAESDVDSRQLKQELEAQLGIPVRLNIRAQLSAVEANAH